MGWGPHEAEERLQRTIDRAETMVEGGDVWDDGEEHASLAELGRRAHNAKWEYEREKMNQLLRKKPEGKNADEREAELRNRQVRPGVQVIDLEQYADLAKTTLTMRLKAIETFNNTGKLTQSVHVSERDHSPGGRRSPSA